MCEHLRAPRRDIMRPVVAASPRTQPGSTSRIGHVVRPIPHPASMKGKSPIRKRRFHGRDVRAVIDTCVLIEATNPHDLYDEYGKLSGRPILPGTDTLDGSMRRGRARDGLLLLEYLQDRRIRTYFLGAEFMRQMAALVPPGDKEFPTHFARVFAHHAQQLLFPRWTTITDSGDAGKVGNEGERRHPARRRSGRRARGDAPAILGVARARARAHARTARALAPERAQAVA